MTISNFQNIIYLNSTTFDGNMSFNTGDKNEVLKNRKNFARKNNFNLNKLTTVNQIHNSKVLIIKNPIINDIKADGMITNQKEIYLMIKLADCLSIAFYDPINYAIGLSHAGWQGLDREIIKETILEMQKNYGTNSQDLLIQISPSIGPCHYGGSPNLRSATNSKWKPYIAKDADENHGIDLWQFAEDQLLELRIKKENIHNPKICTFDSKDYFSHRRSTLTGEKDFRFATILGLC